MKQLHMVAFLLLVVGGLNWLSVGLLETDLVASLLGGMSSMLAKVVYVLVGASAIFELATHKANCRMCASESSASAM
ncbi:MAG: DUF378 domain-containing protein [Candidatus Moraniibacteriota bacterium]|jgi:uncharacterized membrane protein YuzA (DUF378 family)|nr:MAG: DUF378 domain-containing protein [Candidatus Moranbacteria bacterium]